MYFLFLFLPSACTSFLYSFVHAEGRKKQEVHAEGRNKNKKYKLKEGIQTRGIYRRTD
jgi:hypothetical protein